LTEREKKAGKRGTYTLPSEAEWEYACRGGRVSSGNYRVFHFGDSLSSRQANFNGNSPYGGATQGPELGRPCAVGNYKPNVLGLYDMHGNVWEWCLDRYGENYYKNSPAKDPRGPATGTDRVSRGGGWRHAGGFCRSAHRGWGTPSNRFHALGFRVSI